MIGVFGTAPIRDYMKGLYIKTIPFGKGAAGGGITHTIGMINGFFETDIDMTVITANEFDISDERIVNLQVPYNKNGLPFIREFIYFRKYRKALKKWLISNSAQYDFIYCRHRGFCDLSVVANSIMKTPIVLETNDIIHENVWDLTLYPIMQKNNRLLHPIFYFAGFVLKKWIKFIENPVIAAADKIVVISNQVKKHLTDSGYKGEEDIFVLPNGVDPKIFCHNKKNRETIRSKYRIPANSVVVGFAGTFGNWHGIPELTEALKKVAPNKNVFMLLMGDGLMKKDMQQQLSPFDNVHFTGIVPFAEMPAHLDACDILVISNSWDPKFNKPFFGSPTKLFEYMSMGKAIVASKLEQIDEILADRYSALMFKPGDVEGMVEAINRFIADPLLREQLGNNARKEILKSHTWQKNAEKIKEIVENELM